MIFIFVFSDILLYSKDIKILSCVFLQKFSHNFNNFFLIFMYAIQWESNFFFYVDNSTFFSIFPLLPNVPNESATLIFLVLSRI